MSDFVLRAELSTTALWTPDGQSVEPSDLPLSPRLIDALEDWRAFYDDVGGELTDADVVDAFVGQGFRLAHALRRELKGSTVWFHRPDTDDVVLIELRGPR